MAEFLEALEFCLLLGGEAGGGGPGGKVRAEWGAGVGVGAEGGVGGEEAGNAGVGVGEMAEGESGDEHWGWVVVSFWWEAIGSVTVSN